MELERRHLYERNRVGFIGSLLISVSALVIALIQLNHGFTIGHGIRISIAGIAILINCISYNKFKTGENYVHAACIGVTLINLSTFFTATEPVTYAIIYPITIFVMGFLNKKLILPGMVLGKIAILGGHGILFAKKQIEFTEFAVEVIYISVTFVLVCLIINMLSKHTMETFGAVKDKADAQKETSKKIADLAIELNNQFESAQELSNQLTDTMRSSHDSVSEIAKSCRTTAEAVEQQTCQTADIQKSIHLVGDEVDSMNQISNRTNNTVSQGVDLVERLKMQASEVARINFETKNTTEALNNSIKDVQVITETILGISNQTNLLALNASIEAARAGEAGRGFAVVADEIRTLSEGTRQATEQISEIIARLTQDAKTASHSMIQSAEYAQKQNELIAETGKTLENIKSDTDELYHGVTKVKEAVTNVINANTKIMDSISNLSAVSEEVAASTETVMAQSDHSIDAMNDMNHFLDEINVVAKDMKDIIQ